VRAAFHVLTCCCVGGGAPSATFTESSALVTACAESCKTGPQEASRSCPSPRSSLASRAGHHALCRTHRPGLHCNVHYKRRTCAGVPRSEVPLLRRRPLAGSVQRRRTSHQAPTALLAEWKLSPDLAEKMLAMPSFVATDALIDVAMSVRAPTPQATPAPNLAVPLPSVEPDREKRNQDSLELDVVPAVLRSLGGCGRRDETQEAGD